LIVVEKPGTTNEDIQLQRIKEIRALVGSHRALLFVVPYELRDNLPLSYADHHLTARDLHTQLAGGA
jgi:hypothetical protein